MTATVSPHQARRAEPAGGKSRDAMGCETAPSQRIAADLRRAIRGGEYSPGHQLPSGSVLMARYGMARQTVQNPIDLLRVEGLVLGRSGAGWFVREPPVVQRLARNRLSRDERSTGRGAFVTDATDGGLDAERARRGPPRIGRRAHRS